MVKSIKETVHEILKTCGVTNAPVPVELIAQKLGATVRYSAYDGELSGMLYRDENETVIGVNSRHHPNRQRFTIAHEVAHLVLHDGQKIFVDADFRVNFRGVGGPNKEENEANRFAAELLMPKEFLLEDLDNSFEIKSDVHVAELAKKYKVSRQTMSIRLSQLADFGLSASKE